ncbi:Y-family DNA polymerase [Rhodoplanes azumiensis]|uniref:Y-family DNA polymerase n=1 Tax=Rhodoplanes azumiensis TaxID=1897628 RepID=A0ABW5AN82_9BRAD
MSMSSASPPGATRRFLSLWLRRLSTDRIGRTQTRPAGPGEAATGAGHAAAAAEPLVTAETIRSAQRIAAVSDAAQKLGLTVGTTVADARARHPGLVVVPHDPDADAALLDAVAEACDRFTPLVALDPPDGLLLDITGCAHLFGGEAALAAALHARLAAGGLAARIAIADTPGCAFAVARYGVCAARRPPPPTPPRHELRSRGEGSRSASAPLLPFASANGGEGLGVGGSSAAWPGSPDRRDPILLVPPDGQDAALAPLPLAALRLPRSMVASLAEVGLKRIADVLALPRATLAARFDGLLEALDAARGLAEVPISPRRPLPACVAEQTFAEPVLLERDVLATLEVLGGRLVRVLETRGEGARILEAALFRTDGRVVRIAVGTGAPLRDPARMVRLFADRLAVGDPWDPGFGFDLVRLGALMTERSEARQVGLDAEGVVGDPAAEVAHLIDRLSARFGARRVTRPVLRDAHLPEHAAVARPAQILRVAGTGRGAGARHGLFATRPGPEERLFEAVACDDPDTLAPVRPLRLLEKPEPVETIAEVPDGPPLRFRWRRVLHEVAAAEGPERIALPWWRDTDGRPLTRDYFRVECRAGFRAWLYREGLFDRETARPRWFLHGLFG